jgi:hypothetical protein
MSLLSVTSVIRSFVVILSAVSYTTAQIPLGVSMVPNPMMSGNPSPPSPSNSDPNYNSLVASYPASSYSDSSLSSVLPLETGSPAYGAPPSQYTPPPSESSDPYKQMPYSSFTGGGYSQMDCGYGYKKGSDGKCSPESWWGEDNSWGCYQTTIIINKEHSQPYCPPPWTVTVTDKSVETKILTVTYTQTLPTTLFSTLTMTDVKTDTLYVTNTETLPVTLISTSLLVESKTLTMTDTVKEVLTDFVTKTDISVLPTTITSIWVSTDIIDKTNTVERTLTSTVIDEKTLTNTLTYLSTSTKTDVSTQLSVSTSTTTEIMKESALADCLYSCDQYKYLTTGNSNKWNTYASPPAYTPSPTYQPYQYMSQGGGYSQGSGY